MVNKIAQNVYNPWKTPRKTLCNFLVNLSVKNFFVNLFVHKPHLSSTFSHSSHNPFHIYPPLILTIFSTIPPTLLQQLLIN